VSALRVNDERDVWPVDKCSLQMGGKRLGHLCEALVCCRQRRPQLRREFLSTLAP
jgi:hypothetical protein